MDFEKKAAAVATKLNDIKLGGTGGAVRDNATKTLTYTAFSMEHCKKIRANNSIEGLNEEIKKKPGSSASSLAEYQNLCS